MCCSRHLWMSPIKTARSPACPPAAMSNVLPSQQRNVLVSTSHQRWKFHYAVYGYRLTITGNCCCCQLPVFVRASWIHAYRISVIRGGLAGKPDAKFPISWIQFSPQRNTEDRNAVRWQHLGRVGDQRKRTDGPKRGKKKKKSLFWNSFARAGRGGGGSHFIFPCEAVSSRSAPLILLRRRLKAITSRLTEIKTVACPYVLPSPWVLQTAWLRSSQGMGQCPLIQAQQASCPGQVSQRPGAVPSMPRLVPDWIPPSNPFQRLFLWIRYAVWFPFPFVTRRVKGEPGRL